MKTKLLGVVAACTFALNVGTASADIFHINGIFSSSLLTSVPGFSCGASCSIVQSPDVGASLLGTVTITNGALTSVNLTATSFSQSFGFLVLGTSVFVNNINSVLSNLSPDGQSWIFLW